MTFVTHDVTASARPANLTSVQAEDPALTTILLLNAARRAYSRLAPLAEDEPDWAAYLDALTGDAFLSEDDLPCHGTHPAIPVLERAVPELDVSVVRHVYARAFAAELLAHEAIYLAHFRAAGISAGIREALVARIRHEALLRDLEDLIANNRSSG